MSVCHVHALCWNGRRYHMISFAHDSPRSCQNLAYIGHPFLPKFCHKVTHPLLIWAPETFDGKLWPNGSRYHNYHNGEPTGNHHRSLEWYHHWLPTTSPSPRMGVPDVTSGPTLQCMLPPGKNMIEDIDQQGNVCCTRCHYELSDVVFCQITLVLVWMF